MASSTPARFLAVRCLLAALVFSVACDKFKIGDGLSPSQTQDTDHVAIPVTDPNNPSQAFIKYHRVIVVPNPALPASSITLYWQEWKDGQKSGRLNGCSFASPTSWGYAESIGIWDVETQTFVCLKWRSEPTSLPVDTEIEIWTGDGTGAPVGKEFIINGTTLPEPVMGTQPWPVGKFKIGRNLNVYW